MKIKLPYWGIDGCKRGWFCAGLGRNGECDYFAESDIESAHRQIKERGGEIALIDIPIGLRNDDKERECDREARRFVVTRKSSVFRTPCRQAIEAYKTGADKQDSIEKGRNESRQVANMSLPCQTWCIADKIAETDDFLRRRKGGVRIREVHPEVCFCALKGAPLVRGKKTKRDRAEERRKILNQSRVLPCDAWDIVQDVRREYFVKQVANDDILDALAAAVTAKLGEANGYETLTENTPEYSTGLPMEMVYVVAAPTR